MGQTESFASIESCCYQQDYSAEFKSPQALGKAKGCTLAFKHTVLLGTPLSKRTWCSRSVTYVLCLFLRASVKSKPCAFQMTRTNQVKRPKQSARPFSDVKSKTLMHRLQIKCKFYWQEFWLLYSLGISKAGAAASINENKDFGSGTLAWHFGRKRPLMSYA